jgi:hypothetical protein
MPVTKNHMSEIKECRFETKIGALMAKKRRLIAKNSVPAAKNPVPVMKDRMFST